MKIRANGIEIEVEDTGAPGDPRPVVKVAGEQHLIMVPKVRIDGEELTAEQLATRDDLLIRLHKDGSAVLRLPCIQ